MPRESAPIFLSYSHKDLKLAKEIDAAFSNREIPVWRDEISIDPGTKWFEKIDQGIRQARGIAVLVSPASVLSPWVTYEFALALGARIPMVPVQIEGAEIPVPIEQFQAIHHQTAPATAEGIDRGITTQWREINRAKTTTPTLVARFQEHDGNLIRIGDGPQKSLALELWVEGAPPETNAVTFEILDSSFPDRVWTKKRSRKHTSREFLTNDMNSWGDVRIWASGSGSEGGAWSLTSGLFEALNRFYSGQPQSADLRRALAQIRKE